MSQKIRVGNDIAIQWSLIDAEGYPYDLGNRDVSIEIVVAEKKRVRIKNVETVGNTAKFVYYGKDQKYTGRCDLKFIENDGEVEMVTFDTKDAFTLVAHSWLAVDEGETPETIQLEFVTVTSELMEKIGPPGFSPIANVTKVGDTATITITDTNGTTTATVQDGSDATVTRENVELALGGSPVMEETDPTVPNWAKQENKPAYTPQEVGALPAGTELKDLPTDSGHRTVSDAEKASWITKTVSDLTNYYLKSETYTKAEIAQILSVITTGFWQSVPSLPTASADTFGFKIYLVPSPDPKVQNQKDEYITVRNGSEGNYTYAWEQIGSTAIDLSDYVTTTDLQSALSDYITTSDLSTALSGKQDTLVSGTNIKTINNESILGRGNIQIQGGDPNAVKYTEQTLTDAQKGQARTNIGAGTYDKPSGGIPSSDMASAVQTSLGKADTAYQKPSSGIPASDLASGVIPTVPTDVVKYTSQSLTDAQKTQARTNIGAGTSDFSGAYADLSGRPTIPDELSDLTEDSTHRTVTDAEKATWNGKYTKPAGGIPSTDLASGVIPDVSGKESTSNKVTTISSSSTDTQYPSAKAVYDALPKELSDLSDVSDTAPTDGQALLWDGTNEEWKPGTVQGGGGGSVTDVTVGGTSVVNQQGVAEVPEIPEVVQAQEIEIDSAPTANSNNLVTSGGVASALAEKYAKPAGGIPATDLAADAVPVIPVDTAIPSGGLDANTHYDLGTLTGSVSITLDATSAVSGMLNVYSLSFTAGSTAPTITWPSSITNWAGNCLDSTTLAPVITGGNSYEVSIRGGLAVITEFVAS